MEQDIGLGKDFTAKISLIGGKVVVALEFDGADAAIEALRPKLPTWAGPILDFVKAEVDKT